MADPLSSSEAVRDSPEAPPPTPPPTPLQGLSESLIPSYKEAGAREVTALRESSGRRRVEAVGLGTASAAQEAERTAAQPTPLTLPTPPSLGARAFLAPAKDTLDQLQQVITGVTQVALGVGGLKGRGHAIAAVAGLKGALEGWQHGDHERANAALKEWEANSEKLLQEHRSRRESLHDLLTNQKMSMEARLAQIGINERIDGTENAALAAERGQIKDLIDILSQREIADRNYGIHVAQFQQGIINHKDSLALQERGQAIQIRGQNMTDARMRDMAEERRQDRLDLSSVKGGPWVNRKTGDVVDRLTNAEWSESGGNATYKPITKNQMQSVDILQAEAIPQVDQLERLGQKILAKYPGQNLATLMQNYAKGKLSDSDVREYGQARNAVTFTLARALGGSSAVRQFIFKAIDEAETPSIGDTQKSMTRMSENTRTAVINYIRSAKGWEPFALPSAARTIEAKNEKGELAQIKLAPYEPLPAGWQYRY